MWPGVRLWILITFLSKHNLLIKVLLLVQYTIGNPMQFTELVCSCIAYTEGEISEVM